MGVVKITEATINEEKKKVAIKINSNQYGDTIKNLVDEMLVWNKASQYPDFFAPMLAVGLSLQTVDIAVYTPSPLVLYMPIFENLSLDKFLPIETAKSNNGLNEEIFADWIFTLSTALKVLHSLLKIAHADIKPENVLVDKQLNVRITDFGEAAEIDKQFDYPKGTPDYQGEIGREKDPSFCKTTAENDVFGMGLVYVYILTEGKKRGWEEYRVDDPDKRAYKIQEELIEQGVKGLKVSITRSDDKKGFYTKAKNIVDSCLLFHPQERISTDELVRQSTELKKLQNQSP